MVKLTKLAFLIAKRVILAVLNIFLYLFTRFTGVPCPKIKRKH